MKVGFIGFGGAGYGLAKGLKQAGLEQVCFFDSNWDISPYGDVIRKHAAETGAEWLKSIDALLQVSDVVISCVPDPLPLLLPRTVRLSSARDIFMRM